MTNYQRGSTFERKIKAAYETKGYFVVRAAGSHGIADLVAIKQNQVTLGDRLPIEVLLIQCGQITKEKTDNLNRLCLLTGCKPILVQIPEKRKSDPHSLWKQKQQKHRQFKRWKVGLESSPYLGGEKSAEQKTEEHNKKNEAQEYHDASGQGKEVCLPDSKD